MTAWGTDRRQRDSDDVVRLARAIRQLKPHGPYDFVRVECFNEEEAHNLRRHFSREELARVRFAVLMKG